MVSKISGGQGLKLALVSYTCWPPDFGGELLHSIERFQALAARGHEVSVLTSGRVGFGSANDSDSLQVLRSPVVHESRPGRAIRRVVYLGWVLQRLAQLRPDVVHVGSLPGLNRATSWMAGSLIARAAKRSGAATVWVHSLADSDEAMLDVSGPDSKWKLSFLERIDRVVGVSPALTEAIAAVCPEKVEGITYGVRGDIFRPLDPGVRRDVRQRLGAREGDVVFCFAGSLTARKGFDLLSGAFCVTERGYPNWALWVIGPTTHRENQNLDDAAVSRIIGNLQEDKRVTFFGRVDSRTRLAEVLGACDVFMFPSRREGMGLAPAEAMACGTPVIVSRIRGITDVGNVDGETGLFVTPGDDRALLEAMIRLAGDLALRKKMGEAASRRAREVFGWSEHITRWEGLYVSLHHSLGQSVG